MKTRVRNSKHSQISFECDQVLKNIKHKDYINNILKFIHFDNSVELKKSVGLKKLEKKIILIIQINNI
jgi:hypothetical protein